MTDSIDGYLSRLAQQVDPAALVIEGPRGWLLRRPGVDDLRLGTDGAGTFGDARAALQAWVRSQRAGAHNAAVIRRDLADLDRAVTGGQGE